MYLMFINKTLFQIQIQFKRMPIAEDVNIDSLATLTAGYSGAEVRVGGVKSRSLTHLVQAQALLAAPKMLHH